MERLLLGRPGSGRTLTGWIACGKLHRGSTKYFPLERAAEAKSAAGKRSVEGCNLPVAKFVC
jgi:hypothetical protein